MTQAEESSPGETGDEPSERPRRRRRISVIVLSVLLVVLLGGVGVWYWSGKSAESRLEALLAEYRAAGQPVDLEDFDPPATADEDNAALLLIRAAEAVRVSSEQRKFLSEANTDVFRRRLDELGQIVQANAEALDLVRKARPLKGVDWGLRLRRPIGQTVSSSLDLLRPQRELVRLLIAAAIYHHLTGNDAEAVALLRDALAAAETVREMPLLLATLVAMAEEALTRSAIEEISADLSVRAKGAGGSGGTGPADRQEVRRLIADLLDTERTRKALRRTLFAERAIFIDMVKPGSDGGLDIYTGQPPSMLQRLETTAMNPIYRRDLLRTIENITALDEAARETDWPAAKAKLPPPSQSKSPAVNWTRPFSGILSPSLIRALELDYRARAMRKMAATALAIRLYEIDHGRRPNELGELVPEYLPAVPPDPLAAGGAPLGYIRDGDYPRLYSVGSNGVDEAGRYAENPGERPKPNEYDQCFFLDGVRPGWEDQDERGEFIGPGGSAERSLPLSRPTDAPTTRNASHQAATRPVR